MTALLQPLNLSNRVQRETLTYMADGTVEIKIERVIGNEPVELTACADFWIEEARESVVRDRSGAIIEPGYGPKVRLGPTYGEDGNPLYLNCSEHDDLVMLARIEASK